MPHYLKEIKKDKEIISKGSFKIRENFIAPWQNNLHQAPLSPLSFGKNQDIEQEIKPDINSDIKRDILQGNEQDTKPDIQSGIYQDNGKDIELDISQGIHRDIKQGISDINPDIGRDIRDIKPDSNEIVTRNTTRYKPDINRDIKRDIEQDIQMIRHSVKTLTGHRKNLFQYVLDLANLNDGYNSGFIDSHQMANFINCTYPTVKITIFNMIKNGIFVRHKGKGCRGGYIILEIPKLVKNFYLEFNQDTKLDNKRDIPQDKSDFHYNNNNKTIIIEEGEGIDFSLIQNVLLEDGSDRKINFTKGNLKQILASKKLSKEEIQESIDHFAWGIKNSKRTIDYKDPLNVFIGRLCKGIPWDEPNYISEKEITIQKKLERKRAEQERLQKMEDEIFEIEYTSWLKTLNDEQKKGICNQKFIPDYVQWKTHFRENIWSVIKNK